VLHIAAVSDIVGCLLHVGILSRAFSPHIVTCSAGAGQLLEGGPRLVAGLVDVPVAVAAGQLMPHCV
jgi:hypothetical protein